MAGMPALGAPGDTRATEPNEFVDQLIGDITVHVAETAEFASAYALGAFGQALMPFVDEPRPYLPPGAVAGGKAATGGQSLDPAKSKPAQLREAKDNLNKRLRESAFNGVSHLPTEFAGLYKHCSESIHRLSDRLERTKAELARKYPKGTMKDFGKGRFVILPIYAPGGKKILEPQNLAPKPMGSKGNPDFELALAAWEKMKKRADKIRVDAKNEKKATAMKTELLTLKRTIKDLESLSEVERNASRKDKETGKVLPRGEIVRTKTILDKEKKKYPQTVSIAESLVADGADVNDANPDGFTALMYAARNGHYETVKHLLALPGMDSNKCNLLGCNAMHYAAQNAHKEIVELLRKAGQVNRTVGDYTILNRTPKEMALREEEDIKKHKEALWQKTVKERKYLLVEEYSATTKEDIITIPETPLTSAVKFVSPMRPYHFFANIPDPSEIKVKKEWKPGTWRISEIPDPACKLDDMKEPVFLKRWGSAAKKCGPPVAAAKKADPKT